MISILHTGNIKRYIDTCSECHTVYTYQKIDVLHRLTGNYIRCPLCNCENMILYVEHKETEGKDND